MGTNNPLIMTVDDESSVRRVIRTVLEREGFAVVEAASGLEALEKIRRQPEIDLVLSDLQMSGMDGNALAHQLLMLRPNLRLMFVSAFSSELDDCFRHCALVAKPFKGTQLVAGVRSQLTRAAGK